MGVFDTMGRGVFFVGALLLLMTIALSPLFIIIGQRKRWRRERKHPFGEPIPRVPGEFLMKQMEEESDEAFIHFIFPVLVIAAGIPFVMTRSGTAQLQGWGFLAVICIGCAGLNYSLLRRWAEKRANQRLGAEGERFVAYHLSGLQRQGYAVFHDLQMGNWNIDHVVLGENGLFVIETKTRRKKQKATGGHESRATFDGDAIAWEDYQDRESVAQATRNARALAQLLTKETGESVNAQAVVAIPGWWVTSTRRLEGVHVINAKGVESVVRSVDRRIAPAQLRRMQCQLEKLSFREVE